MRIILPNTLTNPKEHERIFFLAGPVRGGAKWQVYMARLIHELSPGCAIAIPCRWNFLNPLYQYRAEGVETHFERQLSWERYYLNVASWSGCIVFWLPCESTRPDEKHPGPEPYAMDTRGELGEWRGRMMHDRSIKLVVGAEPGFLGLSQIERNFKLALDGNFTLYSSMEDTARAAVAMAHT